MVTESKSWWREPDGGRCPRCLGSGYLPEYEHIANGVCFECQGTGKRESNSQNLSPGLLDHTPSVSPESIPERVKQAQWRGTIVGRFTKAHGESARRLLYRLRDEEPHRYDAALRSIENGKDLEVLRHLENWAEGSKQSRDT